MKKSIVGLKELRENMEEYIQKVAKGDSFIVVRRSKPIFVISSVEDDEDSGSWERIGDFSKMKGGGVSAEDLLARLKSFG